MARTVKIFDNEQRAPGAKPIAILTADSVVDAAHAWAEGQGSLALIGYRSGLYAVSFELLNGREFTAWDAKHI